MRKRAKERKKWRNRKEKREMKSGRDIQNLIERTKTMREAKR